MPTPPTMSWRATEGHAPPRIVAVGFRRINKMLQELAPRVADRASVDVLDVGFEQAVARVRALQREQPVDVIVAAGSNGAYLRQHLEVPVVLVKVGGFDLMQALSQAHRLSDRIGLLTYEGMAPDLARFDRLFDVDVVQRSYRTEDEARACVRELRQAGVGVVVGTGVAVDVAEQQGLPGLFLYSMDAVREALADAVEVARAARIEQAKRERLGAVLAQVSDGVIAVDRDERVQTLNPRMAQWLGVVPADWLGQPLSKVCPELSLQATLRLGQPELDAIERVRGKAFVVNRQPIVEQGVLTGAVLTAQDPISIQRADRHIRARIQPQAARSREGLAALVGRSPGMQAMLALAQHCARSAASVLVLGESGTGKERVAQGIHQASDRRDMPFVAVNCAALSDTLLEGELFGHEEGAFTGARKGGKVGLIEAAHRGTLFLDEVGDMPLALQTRLLRVLQEREVLRVGATEPVPVQVRVIAATHADLADLVAQGRFRLDLYYRLNVLRVVVPPLRERLEDLPELLERLLQRQGQRQLQRMPSSAQQWSQRLRDLSPAMAALLRLAPAHRWPGNVRELENVVERLVACWPEAEVSQDEAADRLCQLVPELVRSAPAVGMGAEPARPASAQGRRGNLGAASHDEVLRVLADCGGDRSEACRRLGIGRTTLWRRLRQAGVSA